jgi:hypothetical protein
MSLLPSSASDPNEVSELFDWVQSTKGFNIDKFPKSNNNDEIMKNIGVSLGIKDIKWNAMTHRERLIAIYKKLSKEYIEEFTQFFEQKFNIPSSQQLIDNNYNPILAANLRRAGGKRNKSKKPKRRNSRSKRRKTVSKRRR